MRWRWRERAAAWDSAEREHLRAEYEADRLADRVARLRILEAHRKRLSAAIERLDPSKASWSDVTTALRVVSELGRLEESALAPNEGPGKEDWDDMEAVRAELAARLAAFEARRGDHLPESSPPSQTEEE